MFKFKLDLTGRILSSVIAILTVACTVSLVTLGIRGVRPELKQAMESSQSASSPAVLRTTPDYGAYYVNYMIYIGDTTISHMQSDGALKENEEPKQIWSGADGSLPLSKGIDKTGIILPQSGKEMSIVDAMTTLKPEYVLITLGAENGARYCTEEQFKSYYISLISAIKESSPGTKIILNSIFPISFKYEFLNKGISADKIDKANTWITEIAEEQSVKYLDSASALKNSYGYLDKKYDSGDGLHLSPEGYDVFFQYIRTHGYVNNVTLEEETVTEESSETESSEETT